MAETKKQNPHIRLVCVQTELKAPKNQFNKFGGYHYRSCEDILEAVKPLCKKYGLVLTISDEVQAIGDRTYVVAKASVHDAEGESPIFCGTATGYAREAATKKGMDEAQITGAASSYARKYALNGLFLIDDTKDPDAFDDEATKAAAKTAAPTEQAQPKESRSLTEYKKLMIIIQEWADKTNRDAEKAKAHIEKKQPVEYYIQKQKEFKELIKSAKENSNE